MSSLQTYKSHSSNCCETLSSILSVVKLCPAVKTSDHLLSRDTHPYSCRCSQTISTFEKLSTCALATGSPKLQRLRLTQLARLPQMSNLHLELGSGLAINCSFKILDGQDLGMELFTCCPCVTSSFHCGTVGGWEQRGRPGMLRAGGGRPRPRESRPIPRWRPSERKARWRPSERRPELRQGEEGGLHQLGRQHKI